ncbi:UbiA prenyltransferase family-domain-containing protein [Aspergillus avenaceus]|uniref:UbiA prenyltransferase family-domain-containing protein n=1 Tax=Aspergillus avenaceus TaxID=36643 RepID=A0A5N6TMK3_ASPAV|nr:UbiA prenyltransferase family-domain-containing protein [Aspergillus avenaceus]
MVQGDCYKTEPSAEMPHTPKNRSIFYHLYSLYLFSRNDFKIILLPQTAVGVFQALAGNVVTTNNTPHPAMILARVPLVAFWNWINLLIFNLANQRLPSSIVEDSIIKPWRPVVSGRVSEHEARWLLLLLLPLTICLSYCLNTSYEAMAMIAMVWMYNDLGGADENHGFRNLLNAFAFACYGSGSTIIAAGYGQHGLNQAGYIWLSMIGLIVFTTLQVQDIPDIEGDSARGRRTFPIVHGHWAARWSVALGTLLWSAICPTFWCLDVTGYLLLLVPGALIAYRTLSIHGAAEDDTTYKMWCGWLVLVYLLPLYKNPVALTQDFPIQNVW